MAKQDSLIKVKGTLDDLTFYKTGDGYMIRKKGGIAASRIKSDPAFERTRENMAEFSTGAKAAKVLRAALRSQLINVGDARMTSRLISAMRGVIRADAVNVRGKRNVIDGEIELLQGFEFNQNGQLGQSFKAPYTPAINRATGNLSMNVPAFVPGEMILYPEGATHCKLILSAVEIDFEAAKHAVASAESVAIAKGNLVQDAIALSQTVPAGSTHPLMLLVGLRFFLQENNQLYPLKNSTFNALSLVLVNGGV